MFILFLTENKFFHTVFLITVFSPSFLPIQLHTFSLSLKQIRINKKKKVKMHKKRRYIQNQ